MLDQLIQLIILVLASVFVMIIHELPKAILFTKIYQKNNGSYKSKVYALHQYIDPIGLIFSVTSLAGFSKPFVYRYNDKKTNKVLGITGYISLAITFFIFLFLLHLMNLNLIHSSGDNISFLQSYIYFFLLSVARTSIGMFLVNLFPIATFNMGLLIASKSSKNYYSIISKDYFIKILLILCILLGVISKVTAIIVNLFLFKIF